MTILWVIIYLVAGFGAYWITYMEDKHIRKEFINKFGERAIDVYTEYHQKTQYIPKNQSFRMYILLLIVVFIAVWVLWPLFGIIGGIYEWCVYKHLIRVWSKKLEIE